MYITGCLVGENLEDYWNVDGQRVLSDAWTGFTRFILLSERPPDGYTWSGQRLTRKQTTSRPDKVWPDMWKHMSDAAKMKAKQRWAIEKPMLDKARQVHGILFIEPEDEEFKDIMENARRKLEIPMPAAMPCKIPIKSGETHRRIGKRKTKCACIVVADEGTRPRLEGAVHKHHQDHITEKRMNSMNHYSLVHKFIPMPQPSKNQRRRLQWRMGKIGKDNGMAADESQKQKRGESMKQGMKGEKFIPCHLKNSELEPKFPKYKGRVVLRGDTVKDDSGSHAVFTEQGSSASQMTAAKVMDIISRLPGCAGQAADAVSAL